ncbi:MAG: hypothetical protein IPL53_06335 [Ignavibacteria bacterium]|nr:hypothetical protein [Ignavibacteria bacterium]
MNHFLKISLLSILNIFFIVLRSNSAEIQIRPQTLGLKISKGNIDLDKMTRGQRDTIAIQLFDQADNYYDIAVAYRSRNEIVIYRNLGNGYLSEFKKLSQDKKISSISSLYEEDIRLPNKRAELVVRFTDGSEKKISSKEINKINSDQPEVMVPEWNMLDDAGVFLFNLEFIKAWESEANAGAFRWISYGDFDRDGKEEMVWTFYPIGGTGHLSHMVVFECYGDDLFRIDWDTIFTGGGYNILPYMTDFDRDGNREFFAGGWNVFSGEFDKGIFECTGPGKYKFRGSEDACADSLKM